MLPTASPRRGWVAAALPAPRKSLAGEPAGTQSLTNSISVAAWTPAKLPRSPGLTSCFCRASRRLRPVCCLSCFSSAASKGNGPGWGPRGEVGTESPAALPTPHQSLLPVPCRPIQGETERHPLTSEKRPRPELSSCHHRLKVTLEDTSTFRLILPRSRLPEKEPKALRLHWRC